MLLKVDASQLEWRVKVLLANCPVGKKEILSGFDLHTDNQSKFELPSRTLAKIFVYRMIFADAFGDRGFAGPAYAYANDADFQAASKSPKYWENVVTKFFEKYPAIYEHSRGLIKLAGDTGRLSVPSGRFWTFKLEEKYNGILDLPRTKILNYPVQGFSADLVQVARLNLWKATLELRSKGLVYFINTVHDDIELDVDNSPEVVYTISKEMEKAFFDIPVSFKRMYGSEIDVPMAGEVKYGFTLDEESMKKFKKDTFEQDYKEYLNKHGN